MTTLIVIPTWQEYVFFLHACDKLGLSLLDEEIGRMLCKQSDELGVTVATGGLGKVQFGISTQHLINCRPVWDLVICAGAGGGLAETLSVGDIVIGTETVEYDIKNHFGPPLLPRFTAAERIVESYRVRAGYHNWPFHIHFGPIASGDQDVVDEQVAQEIAWRTQAISVAWEGAGGARACVFSDVPFIEIRGISDGADDSAASDYGSNLEMVMAHLATFLLASDEYLNRAKESEQNKFKKFGHVISRNREIL